MCLELDPDFHIMKLAAPLMEEIKEEKTSYANIKKEIEAQLPAYYSLLQDLPAQLSNI